MTKLGSLIQQARLASGRSLRDVGASTKIAYAAVSRIERGAIKEPSFRAVVRLARDLKIDLEKLAESI